MTNIYRKRTRLPTHVANIQLQQLLKSGESLSAGDIINGTNLWSIQYLEVRYHNFQHKGWLAIAKLKPLSLFISLNIIGIALESI